MSKSDPVNVADAKASFSLLLDRAAAGEEIVISRSGKPVARLMPLEDPPKRVFGVAKHWKISDAAFAPMNEEDLRWAEGDYRGKDGLYGRLPLSKAQLAKRRKSAKSSSR